MICNNHSAWSDTSTGSVITATRWKIKKQGKAEMNAQYKNSCLSTRKELCHGVLFNGRGEVTCSSVKTQQR